MKISKKILSAGLVATSALALASCGGGGTSTLSIFMYQEGFVYNEDMVVFQKANEYAGVELEGFLDTYITNYDSVYNLNAAKINLVVNDQDTIEATALQDGIFADLTDLIAEHAPNLTAYWEKNPEHKEWAKASDGKIYGIPFYTDGKTAKAFFVRQDWVDKLAQAGKLPSGIDKSNLDALTVVQFEALLKAFKDNPTVVTDGKIKKSSDIIPYFDRDSDFAISELASLWGATGDLYVDENGKVHHGAIEESFKVAANNIARWAKAGLIDSQIIIKGTDDKRETYFMTNVGGATHDWIGTTYSFNDDVYELAMPKDFQLVSILPPERADGTRFEPTVRKQIGKVTAINQLVTSEEDQIKLVKWIDWFFSPEGHEAVNFGIEGEHFTKTGDSYAYTDKILNDNNTALVNLYNTGAQMQGPGAQTFAYESAWLSEEANAAMAKYEQYLNPRYNDLIFPNIKVEKVDYKTINETKSAVATVYSQALASWFNKGSVSDGDWNAFVNSMKNAGVENLVAVMQKYVDAKKA